MENLFKNKVRSLPKAKALLWSLFVAFALFSAWAGVNSESASAAATSTTFTVVVNATINSGITMYLADLAIDLSISIPGTSTATDSNSIVITTNSTTGYKIYAGSSKWLEHTGTAGTYLSEANMGNENSPFPYTSSTTGLAFSLSGTPAAAKWAAAGGSAAANYSSFTSGVPIEVNNYATYSAANTTTSVFYFLKVLVGQRSGTYTNTVLWYAVTNAT